MLDVKRFILHTWKIFVAHKLHIKPWSAKFLKINLEKEWVDPWQLL